LIPHFILISYAQAWLQARTREGILKLTCDSERSQHSNKQIVSAKFLRLIENAFRKKKKRIASTPSKQSKEKRLKEKKKLKEKKERRNYTYEN